MFKRICIIFLNKTWQFLAVFVILFAVLITIARYMIPNINDYKDSIENLIVDRTGIEVTIGHLSGTWESLGPVLEIKDIHFDTFTNIDTENIELIKNSSISSVKVSVDILPSLFYRTLIVDQLTIEGLSLIVRQEQSGEFTLTNSSENNQQSTDINPHLASSIQDWLQHQNELVLYNTMIDISLRDDIEYPITLDEIHFRKGKDIYQLIGHSKLPGENQIDFTFEVDGFLSDPSAIGQVYIDTHRINMAELPLNAVWEKAEIRSGSLEMKLWADWKNSQFEAALMSLTIDDFLMSLMDKPQTNLNKFSSYLIWQRKADGWVFESQQTEIISQGRIWPDPSLLIRMKNDEDQEKYKFSASRLDLGIWADLILANPNLDDDLRQQLLIMDPNGFVDDAQVIANIKSNSIIDLRANARFSELTWQPWKKIPGVTNFAGQFEVHEDHGTLIIDSRNSMLDYPSLFRWPFDVQRLNSRLSWTITEPLVTFDIENFALEIADAQLLADGKFDLHRETKVVETNLYAEISHGDISKTKYFLPYSIMKDSLVTYLDQSIKSGLLQSAQAILRGPITSFPFANTEGIFAINANVNNGQYVFTEGWPEIEAIEADLWFVGRSMDIQVSKANSRGQTISHASAVIENFSAKPALLLVTSSSAGDVIDGIEYLNDSPLKDSVGAIFNHVPTKGPFELDLNLHIPLTPKIDVRVDGEVNLLGNSMLVKAVDMDVSNIKGKIILTDSLANAEDISVEIMGGKSTYDIQQSRNLENLLLTTVIGKGEITTDGIRKVFPSWIPALIDGQTKYTSKILFPESKNDLDDPDANMFDVMVDLTVDSNLKGIVSNFPAPFDKKSEQLDVFNLSYKVLKDTQQLITASISERVDMKLHKSTSEAETTGRIVLGGQKASISGQDGIEITGLISQFDLEPWLTLLKNQPEMSLDTIEFSNLGKMHIKELLVEKLKLFFVDFDQVLFSAKEADKKLLIDLTSNDISGIVTVPESSLKLPIDINLSVLNVADQFPITEKPEVATETVKRDSISDPFPALKIQCKKCTYNENKIGSAEVNINPLANGNAFTVRMKGAELLGLDVKGQWTTDDNDTVTTTIAGKMDTHRFGKLLRLFNRQTGIYRTNLKANGELKWQGDPAQFNFDSLFGKLSIDGGKGNQEDISDKGARIFSLLSVGSLARRLTLDFSDLFGDGFYYNGLKADFAIAEGAFSTTNFEIDGASADVEIKGVTDFTNNSIEKCVLVTPELGSSLPVLAGWAITPATGVMVFLMSKIFQPALKVVTGILYKIEGPIDEPIITEISKSEGTAVVDNSGEKETMVITPDSQAPKFSCEDAFKK